MLSRNEFLALVLPKISGDECYYSFEMEYVDDDDNKIKQRPAYSIDQLSKLADEVVSRGDNAYFATASFRTMREGRRAYNAVTKKAFYIDIDAGPTKPYATAKEALTALLSFCKDNKFPDPYIVSSGGGLHVYWVFEEAVDKDVWLRHATELGKMCDAHGLKVDAQVTTDIARVLRVPDTTHTKDKENPRKVKLVYEGEIQPFGVWEELLPLPEDFLSVLDGHKAPIELDATTQHLLGNMQSRFKTILVKSSSGSGCAQIAHAAANQATIEEPLWRAVLSIANACVDAPKAIHMVSKRHPKYSAELTVRKAAETKGPYTCATYRNLNPSVCQGCALNITSPIQLGKEVKEATDNVVTIVEEATQGLVQHTIPNYPFPYVRGANGGVFKKAVEAEEEDEQIYLHDLYVVKRMHDPDAGESVLVRLHMPNDGSREFIVALSSLVSKEKFMTHAAQYGIIVGGRKAEALMNYVIKWVEELQMKTKTEMSHKQFGWLDNNSAIIVGENEITATNSVYSPPSTPTLPIAPLLTAKGDLRVWTDIINVYDKPGMEDKALAFFMGFGSMLIKFTDLEGCLLNLYSKESGSGKTTVLQAINSIWGRPKELMLTPKDTYNSRIQRIGTMRNLAATMDEITNIAPDHMSQLIYDITSGRGKNRLRQHDNAERLNHTSWATCLITSSNRSVQDALFSIKQKPEGELMRLLEMRIAPDPHSDPAWAKAHFGRLKDNYGVAMRPYAQYLIQNLPSILSTTLPSVQQRIDTQAGIRNTERYWAMMVSVAVAGGIVAKRAGLHDIDVGRVAQHGINLIKQTRIKNREYMFDGDEFLGGFLQRHFNETLVVNDGIPKGSLHAPAPIREPRGALTVRYEPDTHLLFIVLKSYRDDCAKTMTNFEETLVPYKAVGAYKGIIKKRMAANTTATAHAGVSALCFDTTRLDFFDDKVLIKPDTAIYVPSTEYPDFSSLE